MIGIGMRWDSLMLVDASVDLFGSVLVFRKGF